MSWAAIITAVIGSVGGIFIGFFNYRQSHQSQIETSSRADITQVTESLHKLLDQLQEDNQDYRTESKEFKAAIKECASKLAIVQSERDEAKRERDEARTELAFLRQRVENLGNPHIS